MSVQLNYPSIEKLTSLNMKKQTRKSFTPEEDIELIKLIQIYGANKWENIASFMPYRNARQCRERWKSFLSPTVINAPWTQAEDAYLKELYNNYGPKWAKITKYFVGRSDYNVKNRWQKIKNMDIPKSAPAPQSVINLNTKNNVNVKNEESKSIKNDNETGIHTYYDDYKNYFEEQQEERNMLFQENEDLNLFSDIFTWENY